MRKLLIPLILMSTLFTFCTPEDLPESKPIEVVVTPPKPEEPVVVPPVVTPPVIITDNVIPEITWGVMSNPTRIPYNTSIKKVTYRLYPKEGAVQEREVFITFISETEYYLVVGVTAYKFVITGDTADLKYQKEIEKLYLEFKKL